MSRHRIEAKPRASFADDLARAIEQERSALTTIRWPSPIYEGRIQEFAREILGLQHIWSRQAEVLEAVLTHDAVAVSAGRKVSKSYSIAILALYWWATYPDGIVTLMSTTESQVDRNVYNVLRQLHARSGLCADCRRADPHQPRPCRHSAILDGVPSLRSQNGLKSQDPRHLRCILGRAAATAEGAAGTSGSQQLVIIDEASGVDDRIIDAQVGNLAGGGHIALFSQRTKRVGYFARCFEAGSGYHQIVISSRESPNVIEGEVIIPGLATAEWISRQEERYGADGDWCRVHIDGLPPSSGAEGGLISEETIEAAYARHGQPGTPGTLTIGLDPAGDNDSGRADSSAFAVIRGNRMLDLYAEPGLSPQRILDIVIELIDQHGQPGEVARVQYDAASEIGFEVGKLLRVHSRQHHRFDAISIGYRDKPIDPRFYQRVRDELAAHLEKWIRNGGSLITDAELEEELLALRWLDPDRQGRARLVEKRDLKRALRRSPDKYDSCSLATYDTGVGSVREQIERQLSRRAASQQPGRAQQSGQTRRSPSSGRDFWGRGRR